MPELPHPERPERYGCPFCGRWIVHGHFKRHLSTHDGRYTRGQTDRAWLDFLKWTGWPNR